MYTETMKNAFAPVPQHTHLFLSACGTKFIDRDSRGWKLYTPALGKWTYFPTFTAAVGAA
jgi:hypothetical protein